jgi:hypothetical protein
MLPELVTWRYKEFPDPDATAVRNVYEKQNMQKDLTSHQTLPNTTAEDL